MDKAPQNAGSRRGPVKSPKEKEKTSNEGDGGPDSMGAEGEEGDPNIVNAGEKRLGSMVPKSNVVVHSGNAKKKTREGSRQNKRHF